MSRVFHRKSILLGIAVAVVAATTVTTAQASDIRGQGHPPRHCAEPDAVLAPSCGAWVGTTDDEDEDRSLATQEQTMGRKANWVRLYRPEPTDRFPTDAEVALAREGRILSYSWKPEAGAKDCTGVSDEDLVAEADHIAEQGVKIVLIVHHEPESACTAEDFIGMFRHVHDTMTDRLAATGNSDLIVWGANFLGFHPDKNEEYYPGDDYVDWIFWNGYNWKYCHDNANWRSFEEAITASYEWAVREHPGKALGIIEFATNNGQQAGENKAKWISDAFAAVKRRPEIKLLAYFHKSTEDDFCERIWDETPSSTSAFTSSAHDPYFNPLY